MDPATDYHTMSPLDLYPTVEAIDRLFERAATMHRDATAPRGKVRGGPSGEPDGETGSPTD
jgi:hypothetical protein